MAKQQEKVLETDSSMAHYPIPIRNSEARACPQSAKRRRIRIQGVSGSMFRFVFVVGLVVVVGTPVEAFASKGMGGTFQTTNNNPSSSIQREGRVVVAPLEVPLTSDTPDLLRSPQEQLPVLTQDLVDLSDLRYDEWVAIANAKHENEDSVPSRYAFRMATAEIAVERSQAGAVSFLARWHKDAEPSQSMGVAVGAAELSPIELEGAVVEEDSRIQWYVTDVVTSSQHRRMGIANRLMDALERHAYHHAFGKTTSTGNDNAPPTTTPSGVTLYLHVKEGNDAALRFYENPQRGYAPPTPAELEGLDAEQLAVNAGTTGQTLLCKTLTADTRLPPPPSSHDDAVSTTKDNDAASATAAATGFGNRSARVAKPKAKKKKPKRKKK